MLGGPYPVNNEYFMRRAIDLAAAAAESGDVPVGCVIVKDGKIIGEGRNRREELGDATAHAEIEAIRQACRTTGSWRLSSCTLYVTLEPCPMCAGSIINSRIDAVHYGAREPKSGCCGSILNLFEERFNHHPKIFQGPLTAECEHLLYNFFQELRKS